MNDFFNVSLKDEIKPEEKSQIKEYFKGKTILLTGATGFLGQLYVEKLLRSDAKEIFLVIKSKKGKTPEERIQESFVGAHFSKLRKHDPNYIQRIRLIIGDLSQKSIGICDDDLKDIFQNVQIVLHAAADVRFDEKLLKLIETNLRGTRELLRIAENIKNLEVFTYISTAYSNCNRDEIREEFYEPPIHSDTLIEYCENGTPEELEELEPLTNIIIRPWPNTYTYTKCLSEDMVKRFAAKFPVVVIRPTIIISTYEDPVPGWCNNIYGLNGVLVSCGMGILRVMPFNRNLIGDVVCADFVINSTLVAMWNAHTEQMNLKVIKGKSTKEVIKPEVYYVGTSVDRPTTWKEIADATNRECTLNPPDAAIWKQCENDTVCPFLFFYYSILFHLVPAIIVDAFLSFTKKTIRFTPIYRKVQKFMIALKFFMQKEFKFTNHNMRKILDKMSPADNEFYMSDVKLYDWQVFSYNYVLGLRRYIGKEEPLNPNSHKKHRIYVLLHTFVVAAFYGFHFGLLWLICKRIDLFNTIWSTAIEIYEFLVYQK